MCVCVCFLSCFQEHIQRGKIVKPILCDAALVSSGAYTILCAYIVFYIKTLIFVFCVEVRVLTGTFVRNVSAKPARSLWVCCCIACLDVTTLMDLLSSLNE